MGNVIFTAKIQQHVDGPPVDDMGHLVEEVLEPAVC